MSTPTRRGALSCIAAVIAYPVGAAVASGIDDELIRLCEQLIDCEREKEKLHASIHSIEDEGRAARRLDRLFDVGDALLERIYDLPDPSSVAGARAMARASIAIADKNRDGTIRVFEDAETLAFTVAEFLATAEL